MSTEGLFRISGRQPTVAALMHSFDVALDPDLTDYAVHDVATLLKVFLRDAGPLFPISCYDVLMTACGTCCDRLSASSC